MARRDASRFEVTTGTSHSAVVVTVRGEVDIASASELRETFLSIIATDPLPDLVVDASGVTFIDSSGIAVLLMAARRWGDQGKRITLREPSATLVRVLDLTGVTRAFDL